MVARLSETPLASLFELAYQLHAALNVDVCDHELLLHMSTLKPASTYAAVNTFNVYVVAEDDNRCPKCQNPAVAGLYKLNAVDP